jgi:hypothetical protein
VLHTAASGDLFDLFHDLGRSAIQRNGGTEAASKVEPLVVRIDGDDGIGLTASLSRYDVQPHAARSDDRHGLAGLDVGGIEGGADPRGDSATQQNETGTGITDSIEVSVTNPAGHHVHTYFVGT